MKLELELSSDPRDQRDVADDASRLILTSEGGAGATKLQMISDVLKAFAAPIKHVAVDFFNDVLKDDKEKAVICIKLLNAFGVPRTVNGTGQARKSKTSLNAS